MMRGRTDRLLEKLGRRKRRVQEPIYSRMVEMRQPLARFVESRSSRSVRS